MTTPVTIPVGRHALGSYPQYSQAQFVVDHLSDSGFPVERVTIVGADLKLVERVTGRLTRGRAAAAGAASTAWLGLLFGLFIGFFADSGSAVLALALYGAVWGAIAGAAFGFAAHAATRGLRDFSSMTGIAATRYEVLVDPEVAVEGERLVALLPA